MLRSSMSVQFSLSAGAVSSPRPLKNRLRYAKLLIWGVGPPFLSATLCLSRRTSTKVCNSQNTSGQPCVSLKRKLTVTWKKVTQAARPAVRHSFIPPGFILVARPHSLLWSTKTKEKRAPGGLRNTSGGEPVMARSRRLKHAFCLWG